MTPRWWRIAILLERDGDPWTWTFHVRAFTEKNARRLVAEAVAEEHEIYVCHPSDPLLKAERTEEIAASYGPYRRSWEDPTFQAARSS